MNKATGSQKIILPSVPLEYSAYTFTQAFDAIRRAITPLVSKDEASPQILLQSPDGTVYAITVSNAGVISTTVNSGKTHS